jgi:hypothetical protein
MARAITIIETLEDGSVNTETHEVADVKSVFVSHLDENNSEVFYQNENKEMISLGMKGGMVSVSFGDLLEEVPTEEVQPKENKKSKKKK